MLSDIDPIVVNAVKSAEGKAMTATGLDVNLFTSILNGEAAATGASGTTTLATSSGQSSDPAKIFAGQLKAQQNFASTGGSASFADNFLLMNLNYQASVAMMNQDVGAMMTAESLIAKQMSAMGITGDGTFQSVLNTAATPSTTYSLTTPTTTTTKTTTTTPTTTTTTTTNSTSVASNASTSTSAVASNASTSSSSAVSSNASISASDIAQAAASNAAISSSAVASNASLTGSAATTDASGNSGASGQTSGAADSGTTSGSTTADSSGQSGSGAAAA